MAVLLARACCYMLFISTALGYRATTNTDLGPDAFNEEPGSRRDAIRPDESFYQVLDAVKKDATSIFKDNQKAQDDITAKVNEIRDAVVPSKTDAETAKIKESFANMKQIAEGLHTGITTLNAAFSTTPPNTVKAASGALSIISAGAVLIPTPFNAVTAGVAGLASFVVSMIDDEKPTGPSLNQIIQEEVMKGLSNYEQHQHEKAIRVMTDDLIREMVQLDASIDPNTGNPYAGLSKKKKDDTNKEMKTAVRETNKILDGVLQWIEKASKADSNLKFEDVIRRNELGECSTGFWSFKEEKCVASLNRHCLWKDYDEGMKKREFFKKVGPNPHAPDAEFNEELYKIRGEMVFPGPWPLSMPCEYYHFPKNSWAHQCRHGLTIYERAIDRVQIHYPDLKGAVTSYFGLQIVKLQLVVRMMHFWESQDCTKDDDTGALCREWRSLYDLSIAKMKKLNDILIEKGKDEDQAIHLFNLKMHSLVCPWVNSKLGGNGIQGWMYSWFERPEMFMRYANDASITSGTFIEAIEAPPPPEPNCPYVALRFGQRCADELYLDIDDLATCEAAQKCATPPRAFSLHEPMQYESGYEGIEASKCNVYIDNKKATVFFRAPELSTKSNSDPRAYPICKNVKFKPLTFEDAYDMAKNQLKWAKDAWKNMLGGQ